ncbi:hypothetical protein TNCT_305771 [Trichonephila clavata]|uniref:Uncharacterized protein n=1 Tax=Trichonephila clavata TaxID=2740835 RepID=A0A8X6KYY1_TRICU|nr:hypothetical protein TNCT_305771 [Trichonephila clavata]
MDELKPTKSSPPNQKIFVHKDLKSCSHAFVGVDHVKKALEQSNDELFPVTKRSKKYFTLLVKCKLVNISVDRLKLACLLVTDSFQSDQQLFVNNRMIIQHLMTLTSYLMIIPLLQGIVDGLRNL